MPTRLTLVAPNRTTFYIDVPDGEFVMNCNGDFVDPMKVISIRTVNTPYSYTYKPFIWQSAPELLQTAEYYCYGVMSHSQVASVEYPDPTIIYTPDPTGGECICGITCQGDEMSFVKIVQIVED